MNRFVDIRLLVTFALVSSVALPLQAQVARTVQDTEVGGLFLSQTDGSPWSAYGAYVGVSNAYSASFFDPLALKANYTRFHVFKPSDDTGWNYFPYTALRSYEAREVSAGRAPIFVTATYQGKKRPVLWAWSLVLNNGVPTAPQQNWQYAVNVGDDRFIKFWVNQYLRPMMWQSLYDVPNLWWGFDESAFATNLYGVLDDSNHFVAGVPWDAPFPQTADAYATSVATFFTRLKALAPDVRTLPNLGSMDDATKFPTIFADAPGMVQENYYEPNPSGYSRNSWLPYFDGLSWFGAQGRVAIMRALVSRSDNLINSYAMYQMLKGPNFFFAPMYEDNGAAVPRSQYARAEADLGAPLSTYQSTLEPGMPEGYRLFSRMYEGGVVYVNWTGKTKTVTLPTNRQYFNASGGLVTQITMADATGAYVSTTALAKAAKPSISPRMGVPSAGPVTITLASETPGAAIYYTTNGSTPTTSSARYSGPFALSSSATVKAISVASSYAVSTVSTAAYTVAGSTPQVQFYSPTDSGPAGNAYPILTLSAVPNASSPVTVNYSVTQSSGSVTNGSVTFLQGDTYRYFPVPVSGADNSTARVVITGASNASVGSVSQFSYTINPSGGSGGGGGGGTGTQATLISPTPGTNIPGTSATFTWSAGSGVSEYYIYVGSVVGGRDIFSTSTGLGLSQAVTNLPASGTIYIRLWSNTGSWQYSDYTYTMGSSGQPTLLGPVPGSTIVGGTATFLWNPGSNVSEYYLYVGSVLGGRDIFSTSTGVLQQWTVSGLPTNGSTIYVRLWALIGGMWTYTDTTYTGR